MSKVWRNPECPLCNTHCATHYDCYHGGYREKPLPCVCGCEEWHTRWYPMSHAWINHCEECGISQYETECAKASLKSGLCLYYKQYGGNKYLSHSCLRNTMKRMDRPCTRKDARECHWAMYGPLDIESLFDNYGGVITKRRV